MELNNYIAIYQDEKAKYPTLPPFNPSQNYPEYPFKWEEQNLKNFVYSGIRELFHILELDLKNYDTPQWNPLGEIISPGEKVLLKPNFVFHQSNLSNGDLFSVIVHGSVLRVVIDYVYIALKGKGEITIADAPLQSAKFEKILELTGMAEIANYYLQQKGFPIKIIDLRKEYAMTNDDGIIIKRIPLIGDPRGCIAINLGDKSKFYPIINEYKRFKVDDYKENELVKHHNKKVNEYLVSKSILESDVIINIPKLKTHKKAGVSLCLKNIIGINVDKRWLPHHKKAGLFYKGDEFFNIRLADKIRFRILEFLKTTPSFFRKGVMKSGRIIKNLMNLLNNKDINQSCEESKFLISEGSWYGNDTIWRTILDINNILFYADKEGNIKLKRQRKFLCIVDGIIAGEEEGPLSPMPKQCGILIGGFEPVLIDMVSSRLMGFNFHNIPHIENAFKNNKFLPEKFDLKKIKCKSNLPKWNDIFDDKFQEYLNFTPPKGWKNHIELNKSSNIIC